MPDPTPLNAFFSYARTTWDANEDQMSALFSALEKQCIDNVGKGFNKWQDQERLKWGDDWEEKIEQVIAESHLFFLFLSKAWLESPICQKELDHFLIREDQIKGKRLFVIEVGPLNKADETEHKDRLKLLKKRQRKAWSKALFAKRKKLTKLCRNAACELKEVLQEQAQRTATKTHDPQSPPPRPIEPTFGIPLVEGDLFIPSQQGDETRPLTGYGQLTFAGWCRLTTCQGPLILGIKSAILRLEASGRTSRIGLHPEFQSYEKPCKFDLVSGRRHTMTYHLYSDDNQPLKGNMLAQNPNDSDVPFVAIRNVAPEDRPKITLTGLLSISPECILQHQDGVDQNVQQMQEAVLAALMAEYGSISLNAEDNT
jgi:hypothetical protein